MDCEADSMDKMVNLYEHCHLQLLVRFLSDVLATDKSQLRGANSKLTKQLGKIFWEIQLNKRPIPPLDDIYEDDVYSAVLLSVPDPTDKIKANIDCLQSEFHTGKTWIQDMLKVMLYLHSYSRKNKSTIISPKSSKDVLKDHMAIWLNNVERGIPAQETLTTNYFTYDSICTNEESIQYCVNSPLSGLLKQSQSWPTDDDDSPSDIDVTSSSSSTLYNLDEGFVTPGDETESGDSDELLTPHDVLDEQAKSALISFGGVDLCEIPIFRMKGDFYTNGSVYHKEPSFFSLETQTAVNMQKENLLLVTNEELIHDVKALLLGIPSKSFSKVNGKFSIKNGLCIAGLDPDSLAKACSVLIWTGENFLTLEKISSDLSKCPSVILAALKPCIDKYCYKYQSLVSKFSYTERISLIQKHIEPVTKQIEFLVSCLSPLPDGIALINHLYDCLIKIPSTSAMFHLIAVLFYCSCKEYFSLLDKWIFYGEHHPDLFIVQNTSELEITDRDTFLGAYTFKRTKAPSFLPSLEIYKCGLNYILLRLCSKDPLFNYENIDRPRISLCPNYEYIQLLECKCLSYYELCSSRPPQTFKMDSGLDIDMTEMAKKRELTSARILNDIKLIEMALLRQKEIKELLLCRDVLHEHLNSAFLKLKEDVEYERLIKVREETENQKLELEKEKYSNVLIEHYQRLVAASEKTSKFLQWKKRRFQLSEKTAHFFMGENDLLDEVNGSDNQLPDTIDTPQHMYFQNDANTELGPRIVDKTEHTSLVDERSDSRLNVDELKSSNAHTESQSTEGSIEINAPLSAVNDVQSDSDETYLTLDNAQESKLPSDLGTNKEEPRDSEKNEMKISWSQDMQSTSENLTSENSEPSYYETASEVSSKKHDTNCDNDLANSDNESCDYTSKYAYDDNFQKKFLEIKINDLVSRKVFEDVRIDTIISKSISIPLKTQTKLLDEKLLHVFYVQHDLFSHISALRKYFFLNDGIYGAKLTNALFKAISEKTPAQLFTFDSLGTILQDACGDGVKELTFEVSETPVSFDLTNPQVLDCLSLVYKPHWPLNLILTNKSIVMYNTVFAFVISIELSSWCLKKLFFLLQVKSVDLSNSAQYKQIQLHRHIMSQFVSALKCYLAVVVFESSWRQLETNLSRVSSCEELYKTHSSYLKDIRFKCFLNESSNKMLDHLMKLLQCVNTYCLVYEYGKIDITPQGKFHHQKYAKLNHTFQNFLKVAKYFIYIVQSYAQNKKQKHFEILLEFLHNSLFLSSVA